MASKLTYLLIFLPFFLVGYVLLSGVQEAVVPRASSPLNLYLESESVHNGVDKKAHPLAPVIHSGIPRATDYSSLAPSAHYSKMEKYSNDFVTKHSAVFESAGVWSVDPLHTGLRSWEYAYTTVRLEEALERYAKSQEVKVMDMGSGVSFFPFWVMDLDPRIELIAVDSSPAVGELVKEILNLESKYQDKMFFMTDDFKTTKAHKTHFDIIYCVSALSFTSNFAKTVQHMKDLLLPGGTLIITFDLSIDHLKELSEDKAHVLLAELNKHFCDVDPFRVSISEQLRTEEGQMWSTTNLEQVDPKLLQPYKPTVQLTVVTATYRKCK